MKEFNTNNEFEAVIILKINKEKLKIRWLNC
jgi:hypothetical protein